MVNAAAATNNRNGDTGIRRGRNSKYSGNDDDDDDDDNMTMDKDVQRRLRDVWNLAENQICCDCGDVKPTWASIVVPPPGIATPGGDYAGSSTSSNKNKNNSMGAFCCFHCSGAHRRLGVHICFVRSITLDDWKEHEVQAMEVGGNTRVNKSFEALLKKADVEKPTRQSNLEVRDRFIRAKYRDRAFFDPSQYQPKKQQQQQQQQNTNDLFWGMSNENLFALSKAEMFHVEATMPIQNKEENTSMEEDPFRDPPIPETSTSPTTTRTNSKRSPTASSRRRSSSRHRKSGSSNCGAAAASSSKSPTPEARSSSRTRQQPRSRRSGRGASEEDAVPLKHEEKRKHSSSATSRSSARSKGSKSPVPRPSSQRSSSRSRRSHVKESTEPSTTRSSSNTTTRMRCSSSGNALEKEEETSSSGPQTTMRRSGSGMSLERRRTSSRSRGIALRRSGSGQALEEKEGIMMRTSQSAVGLVVASKSTMRRSRSGNAVRDYAPTRSSRRRSTENTKTTSRNETFMVIPPSNTTSAATRGPFNTDLSFASGSSPSHGTGTRFTPKLFDTNQYALEEFSVGLSSSVEKPHSEGDANGLDPLAVAASSSHGGRSSRRTHRGGSPTAPSSSSRPPSKSRSPVPNHRPLSGRRLLHRQNSPSDIDPTGMIARDETQSSPRGSSNRRPLSGRRSLSRQNSPHDMDSKTVASGIMTSRRETSRTRRPPHEENSNSDVVQSSTHRRDSRPQVGRPRCGLYRSHSSHDLGRWPPSRETTEGDCGSEKSVNPTISLSSSRHSKSQQSSSLDSRSEQSPKSAVGMPPRSVSSTDNVPKDDAREKFLPSSTMMSSSSTHRTNLRGRRSDPLSSRSEHISTRSSRLRAGRNSSMMEAASNTTTQLVSSAASSSRDDAPPPSQRGTLQRTASLSSLGGETNNKPASKHHNSLSSASTHGNHSRGSSSSRKRVPCGTGSAKKNDQVFRLFTNTATETDANNNNKANEGTEEDTEGTISGSSDGSSRTSAISSRAAEPLSAAARRALEELNKALVKY